MEHLNETPEKPKKAELTIEQAAMKAWDAIVQQAIEGELAPKGYKRILNGRKTVANRDYLSIETVQRTGVVACKALRSYRMAVMKVIDDTLKVLEEGDLALETKLASLGALDIMEKKKVQREVFISKIQIGSVRALKESLGRCSPSVLNGLNPEALLKEALQKQAPKIEIVKS